MEPKSLSGYSHALFASGMYLRKYAEEVDKEENGGNDNGVIDGGEIEKFKDLVKTKTGYDFSFDGMTEVTNKTVPVKEKGEFLFNTTTEIAKKYGNAATVKTIDWVNNKQSGKDLLVPSRNTLDIPFMTNEDFNTSKECAKKQEKDIREIIEKQNEERTKKENEEYSKKCESTLTKFIKWIVNIF